MASFVRGSPNLQYQGTDVLANALGMGLGTGLNTYFANRSLDQVLQDKALREAPLSKKLEAFRTAMAPYGENGQRLLQQRLAIEQQEKQEAEQDVLGRVTAGEKVDAKDLSKLSPENQFKVQEFQQRRQFGKNVYKNLIAAGYPDETAQLWQNQVENSTIGGLSDTIKAVNQLLSRSEAGKGNIGQASSSPEDQELHDIIASQDEGLTPSEKVSRQSERFKIGQPIREDAATKLRGFARDKERLAILDSLNKSGKLPKDFGLLNVDKEGNLRFPFAASPEAQRYVKTLNEFSSAAKDTFGARVTNFDLAQFLKRFPTLLNSEEGRRQIAEQMRIVNEINSVYYKNLQDIFSKAGGARRIDSDIAEDLAEKRSEQAIDELVKKFDDIGKFNSLPAPSEFAGKKFRNKETGEVYISDGKNWTLAQ